MEKQKVYDKENDYFKLEEIADTLNDSAKVAMESIYIDRLITIAKKQVAKNLLD